MTRTIRMKDIAGLKANATTAPFVTTEPAKIGGVRGGGVVDPPPSQGLIFHETFSDLPDYTSSDELSQGMLDGGWTNRRNGEVNWSPSTGHPDKHDAFEITGEFPDRCYGSNTKAMVCWRESKSREDGTPNWNTDGILSKKFDQQYQEICVRYRVKFQPGWTEAGQTKMVRFRHVDAGTSDVDFYSFFSDGKTSGLFQNQYGTSEFGLRNFLSFRADPQETNYSMDNPDLPNLPRNKNSTGDVPLNFDSNIRDLGDGQANPITLIDKTTGGILQPGTITHEQVYGDDWNTIVLYAKMNSAPGVQDGVAMQWVNGQLCFRNETVPWMGTDSPGGLGWNCVDIGGNDNWNTYPDSSEVEEWYSYGEVEVFDSLPEELQ